MEDKAMQVVQGVKPNVVNWIGAAMTYMIATELVSLIENLEIFGLNVPLLGKLLDVAQGEKKE